MTKKWIPLIVPMGSCSCCAHEELCEKVKEEHGFYSRFRCPLLTLIEEGTGSISKRQEGWSFKDGEWVFRKEEK